MLTNTELAFDEARFIAEAELFERVEQLHPLPDTPEKIVAFKRDVHTLHKFFFQQRIAENNPEKEILGLDSPLAIALAGKLLGTDGGNVFPNHFENYSYSNPGSNLAFLFPTNTKGLLVVQKMTCDSPEKAKKLDQQLQRTLAGLYDPRAKNVQEYVRTSTTYLVKVSPKNAQHFADTFRGSAFE